MYSKDPYEAKQQLLITRRKGVGLKHYNDSKAFVGYSNDMYDVFENIEKYNPNMERKILIIFDDMVDDMLSNKKLQQIVTDLFIRGRQLKIALGFITKYYFAVPKK